MVRLPTVGLHGVPTLRKSGSRSSAKTLCPKQHDSLRSTFDIEFEIQREYRVARSLFRNAQPCRKLQIVEAIGNGVSQIFFARGQRPLTGFTRNEIGDNFDKAVKTTITGQRNVIACVECFEACAGDGGGHVATTFNRNHYVARSVQNQRRAAHQRSQRTHIKPRSCLHDLRGTCAVAGQTLLFVERGHLLGRGIRDHGGGEKLLHGGIVAAPAQLHQPHFGIVKRRNIRRWIGV